MFEVLAAVVNYLFVFRDQTIDFFDEFVHKIECQWSKVRVISFVKIGIVHIDYLSGLRLHGRMISCAEIKLACKKNKGNQLSE